MAVGSRTHCHGVIPKHSMMSQHRKIQIFNACIGSQSGIANRRLGSTKQTQKIPWFHTKCFREILHVPHSFIGRVSNCQVFCGPNAGHNSKTLACRQLMLFHQVAMQSVSLAQHRQKRRRVPPRKSLGPQVVNLAVRAASRVNSLEGRGSMLPAV